MSSDDVDRSALFKAFGMKSADEEQLGCYDGTWRSFQGGAMFESQSPATGKAVCRVRGGSAKDVDRIVETMTQAQAEWADWPAPKRGEVVRQIGESFRQHLNDIGRLISLENGKVFSEGKGEVQELIDVCDMACGMSRQLEGKVLPSERPGHVILERWHPVGLVGVITAFNFPVAVLGWNLSLSLICGNCTLWKGSEVTPGVSIAVTRIIAEVLERNGVPPGVFCLCTGGREVGEAMVECSRMKLLSFTGSCATGRKVAGRVAERFGKCLLELGGNNASVVLEDADLELAVRGSLFGAVGTCGQRCTSLRRLYVQESVFQDVLERLKKSYTGIKLGDPLDEGTLCGPLISKAAVELFESAVSIAQIQGGRVHVGGKIAKEFRKGNFVLPTLIEIGQEAPVLEDEVFAPILYVIKVKDIEQAIRLNNAVPQGLSSSIYTRDMRKVFQWLGPNGSDCGLVNVNIGTSGAEIGGAFGGEKETGGGRESGSDSWKQYMRRTTCTINYSDDLPLAQGVEFDVAG